MVGGKWFTESLTSIVPKILLREDIWTDLNFTNEALLFFTLSVALGGKRLIASCLARRALEHIAALATLVRQQYMGIVDKGTVGPRFGR